MVMTEWLPILTGMSARLLMLMRPFPGKPSGTCASRFWLAVPDAQPGTASLRAIAVLNAASLAAHGRPALVRRGWECPRTPSPAARIKQGEVLGFAPSSGPALRRLHVRRSRPGPRQLADRLPAPGAQALRVRGLRLHLREGVDRGAAFRPAALPAGPSPETTNRSQARRVSANPAVTDWSVT